MTSRQSRRPHVEHHFTGSESVRDVVIGMTLISLAVFGAVKGSCTRIGMVKSGLQTSMLR